jgi:hypothetical protein
MDTEGARLDTQLTPQISITRCNHGSGTRTMEDMVSFRSVKQHGGRSCPSTALALPEYAKGTAEVPG